MKSRTNWVIGITAAVAIAATGCGKKDGDGGGSGPGKDWSAKALTPTEGKVKGVAFKVSLPEGMKVRDSSDITMSWEADLDDNFSEPGVSVSFKAIPPKTLEAAITEQMFDDKDVVAKKESIDGGFVIVSHTANKGIARATVYKKAGDEVISCRASQAKTGGVPNFDATLAWLESICMSLTPEPVAAK